MISTATKADAKASLGALAPFLEPPAKPIIVRWLGNLGALVAGNLSADEARAKASLMANMLADSYPAGVFTPDTLKSCAKAFKFFPSYSELAEILDQEARKLKRLADRLGALASDRSPKR